MDKTVLDVQFLGIDKKEQVLIKSFLNLAKNEVSFDLDFSLVGKDWDVFGQLIIADYTQISMLPEHQYLVVIADGELEEEQQSDDIIIRPLQWQDLKKQLIRIDGVELKKNVSSNEEISLCADQLESDTISDSELDSNLEMNTVATANHLDASNLEVSNLEVSNLEVSNLEVSNLEVSNLEVSNLEVSNLEVSNLEVSNLEVSNLEVSNLEVSNLEVSNLEVTQEEILDFLDMDNMEAMKDKQKKAIKDVQIIKNDKTTSLEDYSREDISVDQNSQLDFELNSFAEEFATKEAYDSAGFYINLDGNNDKVDGIGAYPFAENESFSYRDDGESEGFEFEENSDLQEFFQSSDYVDSETEVILNKKVGHQVHPDDEYWKEPNEIIVDHETVFFTVPEKNLIYSHKEPAEWIKFLKRGGISKLPLDENWQADESLTAYTMERFEWIKTMMFERENLSRGLSEDKFYKLKRWPEFDLIFLDNVLLKLCAFLLVSGESLLTLMRKSGFGRSSIVGLMNACHAQGLLYEVNSSEQKSEPSDILSKFKKVFK